MRLEGAVSDVARRQLGAMRDALAFKFQVDEFEDKSTGLKVLRLWKPSSQAAAVAVAKAEAQVAFLCAVLRPLRCDQGARPLLTPVTPPPPPTGFGC